MNQKNELDERIHDLILKKRELCLQEDRHEIKKKEFENKWENVDAEWREATQQKINEIKKQLQQKEQVIDSRQKELKEKTEKIKRENRKNAGRKKVDNSFSSLIVKALLHPKIDSEEKVIAMVMKWKEGGNKEKLRLQIRNIISNIKNKKQRRFVEYDWDKNKYMVIKNE